MNDLVVVIDGASRLVVEANEQGCRLLDRPIVEIVGRPWTELVRPGDCWWLPEVGSEPRAVAPPHFEQRVEDGSGEWRTFDARVRPIGGGHFLLWGRDVSRQAGSVELLTDLVRLVELTDDGLVAAGDDGTIRFVNAAAALRLFGNEPAELVGHPVTDVVLDGDENDAVRRIVADALRSDGTAESRVDAARPDGSPAVMHVKTVRDTTTGRWYFRQRDVTESVTREQKLRKLGRELRQAATTDQLTGLTNRALLTRELEAALERGTPFALALLDMDDFKLVNESLGHAYGDQLLRFAADRLIARARPQDVVSRFGGDEFVILMPDVGSDEAVSRGDEIRERLAQPYDVMGRLVHSSCSVGIAMAEPGRDSANELFRNVEIATYEAKAEGRNGCVLFDSQLREQIQRRFELEADLYQALARDEIGVALQGIFGAHDRRLVAFESLVRWRHPVKGVVPPSDFIDLAEECGLLDAISERVLTMSLEHLASWLRNDGKLTVNFAPSQLAAIDLPDRLLGLLGVFDVPPSAIVIEITEVGLTGAIDAAMPVLERLRQEGFHLAIDDFGKGASSLGYLRDLPISVVKIDGGFVHRLADDSFAATIISSVTELADRLGLVTVAECIETEEQLQLVAEMGCDRVQGYLLHRPSPPSEALELIERRSTRTIGAAGASTSG